MKQLLFLSCLLLIAITSNAQDGIMPFTPHLQSKTFDDLEDFKEKVKNARIVFLGDMIHGESNIDASRIYIVKMLIEELGFEVLAFESGIYDLHKAELLEKDEGMSVSETVKESVFPIWTAYASFQPLLEYLESKNGKIKTIGFDPQRSGSYASEIGDDLSAFLTQCGVEYDASVISDWDFLCDDLSDFTLPADFNKLYFTLINKKISSYIKLAAQSPAFTEKAAIWKQIVESKKQMVSIYSQKGYLKLDAATFKAKDSNLRDQYMAENLQFYLNLYPDKKFICWGASTHFAKSTQSIENEELNEFKPMGSYIKEKYGDKAVVIGATGYKGQYGWAEELHDMPEAAENSLETILHKTGHKNALVDLAQFKDKMPLLSSTFVEEGYQINGHWDKVFDWFLFVDEVYPKTIESATNLSEKKVTEESKEALEEGFDFMLPEDRYKVLIMSRQGTTVSGKVLDKHKQPVPFSSVAVKGKSYGTITDENGVFSFLVPDISRNDSLVFSNVAYQSKTLAVAELRSPGTRVIIMEEKILALPELIISSKNNTAEGIIIAAINRIEDNYYQDPFSFKILYHTIKKDTANEKIFNIDWTALNYFEKGYQSERGHGTKGFYSGEGSRVGAYNLENKKTEKYSKHEPSWREFVGLWLHDFVKYRRNNFLNKRNLRHYDFKIADTFQDNGNTICQIDFKCTKINSKTVQYYFVRNFNGSLFIDLDDYAIIKIKTEALIDKEKILKRPKWDLENLDSTWVMKKEVDYKKAEKYYFIHHTEYYDNYSLNAFADIYYFDFELKERPIEANNHTYEQVKFSDNGYWQGIYDKIKE